MSTKTHPALPCLGRACRYSFLGAMPAMEIIACQNQVTVLDHVKGTRKITTEADPMLVGITGGGEGGLAGWGRGFRT